MASGCLSPPAALPQGLRHYWKELQSTTWKKLTEWKTVRKKYQRVVGTVKDNLINGHDYVNSIKNIFFQVLIIWCIMQIYINNVS